MKEKFRELQITKIMRNIIIYDILIPSIYKLYDKDFKNVIYCVSERNICARLAHHIENNMRQYHDSNIFQGYFADVEYNRMNDGNLKRYEDCKKRPRYMVSDLLIHSRDERPNLLAVEMKRKGNSKNVDDDKDRLRALVKPTHENSELNCVCGTLVGAFITYSNKDVKIELFENVDGQGVQTDEIRFACIDYGQGQVSLERI